MKHSHQHENLRSAGLQLKHARSESTHPPARAVARAAGAFDDSESEAETPHSTGNRQSLGTPSDLERLESQQASERNKNGLNSIQYFWPTPSGSTVVQSKKQSEPPP